ncbi:MAG: hypothetical protein ACRD9S_13690 [Pyrinomonadaceae bacterium]
MSKVKRTILEPPSFCQYADGQCDQDFGLETASHAIFLYPTEPEIIASTIEEAVTSLQSLEGAKRWLSWKDFGVLGQVIFCKICISMRFADFIVADVTTLNFNLLFEIGYAVGLGKPVLPIRDTNLMGDKKNFDELGLLDTLGCLDFQNSQALVDKILPYHPQPIAIQLADVNRKQPIYLLKAHVENEGQIRLIAATRK